MVSLGCRHAQHRFKALQREVSKGNIFLRKEARWPYFVIGETEIVS